MIGIKRAAFGLAAALLLGTAMPAMAEAPDPVGAWHGAITAPAGPLMLIVYVTKNADGTLTGEIESVDQNPGERGKLDAITMDGGHFGFEFKAIGANYSAEWDDTAKAWKGTFHQGADLPLIFEQGLPPAQPVVEGLDGRWEALLKVNNANLHLALRVRTTPELGTHANFDSPDQMAFGLAVKDLKREGQTISFGVPLAVSTWSGQLSEDGTQLVGTWKSNAAPEGPLNFTRTGTTTNRSAIPRPQLPKEPFPYKAEEVGFENTQQGNHLAGTLTLPEGKGPFPTAVMITGSGAQDRDETLMGHKPFLVIADYLTRHGIAVLRFDDRGVGGSTGDYAAATSADLATDANAAFAYLRTRSDIDPNKIGFIGHSEGGMIGPIAMADNPAAAYLVMLAGPGTGLEQLMLSQQRLLLTTMGLSDEMIDKRTPVMAAVFHAMATAPDYEAGIASARALLTPDAMEAIGTPRDTSPDVVMNQLGSKWFWYFFRYDAKAFLGKIRVPVLALNGSLDRQVPAAENLPAIREGLAGNPDVTITELPGLNHLFQHATTGGIGEYGAIEETFSPKALQIMADWINARFGKR